MKLSTNHYQYMGELHAKFHQNWWSGFRDIAFHDTEGHSFIIIRILNDRQSRISTYRFYTLNSQRSEKTQLTQDTYIFCFILYTIRNKNTRKVSCMKVHWSLSLGL